MICRSVTQYALTQEEVVKLLSDHLHVPKEAIENFATSPIRETDKALVIHFEVDHSKLLKAV